MSSDGSVNKILLFDDLGVLGNDSSLVGVELNRVVGSEQSVSFEDSDVTVGVSGGIVGDLETEPLELFGGTVGVVSRVALGEELLASGDTGGLDWATRGHSNLESLHGAVDVWDFSNGGNKDDFSDSGDLGFKGDFGFSSDSSGSSNWIGSLGSDSSFKGDFGFEGDCSDCRYLDDLRGSSNEVEEELDLGDLVSKGVVSATGGDVTMSSTGGLGRSLSVLDLHASDLTAGLTDHDLDGLVVLHEGGDHIEILDSVGSEVTSGMVFS